MKLIAILLLLGGCTTLTDEQRMARDADLAEARDAFMERAAACKAMRGTMVFTRRASEMGRWSKFDYQSAHCTRLSEIRRVFN